MWLSVSMVIDSVFKYLTITEGGNVSKSFAVVMARDNGLDLNSRCWCAGETHPCGRVDAPASRRL
jgi:hypothetical protein